MIQFENTQLSDVEKKHLSKLKIHPGFKVIQKIEKDQRDQLWNMLIRLDIDNEESRKIIKRAQYYAQGREDFLKGIEMNSLEIFTKEEDMWGISMRDIEEL